MVNPHQDGFVLIISYRITGTIMTMSLLYHESVLILSYPIIYNNDIPLHIYIYIYTSYMVYYVDPIWYDYRIALPSPMRQPHLIPEIHHRQRQSES